MQAGLLVLPSGEFRNIERAAADLRVDRDVVGALLRLRKIPVDRVGTAKLIGPAAFAELREVVTPPPGRSV